VLVLDESDDSDGLRWDSLAAIAALD